MGRIILYLRLEISINYAVNNSKNIFLNYSSVA